MSGKVQGVWYRASTEEQARRLGLAGWVRNLPDGRVEAVFEGPDERLEQIVEWLWRGPLLAKVTEVRAEPEREEGLRGFEVRR